SNHTYHEFFVALNEQTIHSFDKPQYDIQPIIQHLCDLGSNHTMRAIDLTRKLCFLLAITSFMRPSDIERIDDARTTVNPKELRMVVVRPKEKRNGQRIEKVIFLQRHQVDYLCPVQAYETYKTRFCQEPCVRRYPSCNGPRLIVHKLVRAVHNNHLLIGSGRISNHIKHLLRMIPQPEGTSIPKARALGSTAAVLAGASLEDVLVHGSWVSSSVFDTYYRLSRDMATNFTRMAL
ncbi:hypothetical protein BJV82DRAFT_488202, partial [Fennellomyces sp. T-0311]